MFRHVQLVAGLMMSLALFADPLVITERLGRTWQDEVVMFPLDAEMRAAAEAGQALVDPQGTHYLYQLLPDGRLAVRVSLEPEQRLELGFGGEPAVNVESDLIIGEEDGEIRLYNSRTGIALRRALTGRQGPIAGLRLTDGTWVGDSLLTAPADRAYGVEVTMAGPLLAEAICRIGEGDDAWTLRITLQAGEPVVTVQESFAGNNDVGLTLVTTDDGFSPDTIFYRFGKSDGTGRVGTVAATPLAEIADDTLFVLQPWLHWWERTTQGNWFGLSTGRSGAMLTVAAWRPSIWVDPQDNQTRAFCRLPLRRVDGQLQLHLAGGDTGRAWMIGSFEAEEAMQALEAESLNLVTPLPQQYLIKHGHFPLADIQQMVLSWTPAERRHPHLFIGEEALEDFRERYVPDAGELRQIMQQPITMHQFDRIFYHYLGGGDDALTERLIEAAVSMTHDMARRLYEQDDLVYYGFAPHHQNAIRSCAMIVDLIFNSDLLDDARREAMLAKLAFMGYAVSTSDYWSPARGYSANPNMTTFASSYVAVLGALLREHPEGDRWLREGMSELERQIREWSGPNGGWLEAPHYCMASYDPLIAYFTMAHLAGYSETLFAEETKKVALWMAKISTPPDARLKGWRHMPPIGHTYKLEPCGLYGLLAALWRDHDPELSAHMRWMYDQQGQFATPGVGGFFAAFAGYRRIYKSIELPATAPAWGSELFPAAGVVLRAHFPSERETMLHMIQGNHHAHYDQDSGSITIWGKGHIVADDFGYSGNMPAADHSMMDVDGIPGGALLHVDIFDSGDQLDYVSGKKQGWRRQIAFAKDADPLGPNFFVLRDTLDKPTGAAWRLWLTAKSVTVNGPHASVVGDEDVDTEVALFGLPEGAAISTEDLTRETWGLDGDARYGRTSSTQTGLIVKWQQGAAITAVIYPRLRGEEPPVITALADGAGFKVESSYGTDYLFLSEQEVTIEADGIAFRGTVGSVQLRADQPPQVQLGAAGSITYQGKTVSREP